MTLIIGLGNTGDKYKNTRHNTGFMLISKLAKELNLEFKNSQNLKSEVIKNSQVILAKPTTMMNNSGESVKSLSAFYMLHTTDIYVAHDDLDIKLGEYKIQKGVGPKVHNGVTSVENHLKSKDFWRIRIGVDNRDSLPRHRVAGETYVLQNFLPEEKVVLTNTLDKLILSLNSLIS